MRVSNNHGKNGRCPFKHPLSDQIPVAVKEIALEDETYPWQKRTLAQGAKGSIEAQIKWVRDVACCSTTRYGNYLTAEEDIWLYIRNYEDGSINYFICNAPEETELSILDWLATQRWSIEQCFQECKSYLGMTHYEIRTYRAWHRHMVCVMIAHLFTIRLRITLKKTSLDNAYDQTSDIGSTCDGLVFSANHCERPVSYA